MTESELLPEESEESFQKFNQVIKSKGAFNWLGVLGGIRSDDPNNKRYGFEYYLSERSGLNITEAAKEAVADAVDLFDSFASYQEPILFNLHLIKDNECTASELRIKLLQKCEHDKCTFIRELNLKSFW